MNYITGHNGFIGSHLKNKIDSYDIDIDLMDNAALNRVFSEYTIDNVYHCAGKVGGIQANINNQFRYLHDNIIMTFNLIRYAIEYKVSKVIFLGSSCIYPKDYKQPLKEDYLLRSPLEPTNEGYALAKIAGLKLCEYGNKTSNTFFLSLMPCNVYGPGDNFTDKGHVMAGLIKKMCDAKKYGFTEVTVWGNGKAKREFLYVDDLIDAIQWVEERMTHTDTFINVGSGKDISIKKLAYMIRDIVGYTGKILFNKDMPTGMKRKCLDTSKINKLGWYPKVSLEEGIKRTVEYYDSIS